VFVYYLTEVLGLPAATTKDIEECFRESDLPVPGSVSAHLSKGLKSKPRRLIKVGNGGYRFERHHKEKVAARLGAETHTIQISPELRTLESEVPEGSGKEWLREALDCFGVEAYRATLVMVWLYALDHLFQYTLLHHLKAFNEALAKHPDQKTVRKVGEVKGRDQFTLLGEEMFIDVCRSAHIISPDVKRILVERLGNRNSAAHPSGVKFTRHNVVSFVESLVHNVILKYPL
jgi:hypothetical protein